MNLKARLDRLDKTLTKRRADGVPRHVILLPSNGRAYDEDPRKPHISYCGAGNWLLILPHDNEASRAFEAGLEEAWGRPWRLGGRDILEWQDAEGAWRTWEAAPANA
jgi:hypothetical protein